MNSSCGLSYQPKDLSLNLSEVTIRMNRIANMKVRIYDPYMTPLPQNDSVKITHVQVLFFYLLVSMLGQANPSTIYLGSEVQGKRTQETHLLYQSTCWSQPVRMLGLRAQECRILSPTYILILYFDLFFFLSFKAVLVFGCSEHGKCVALVLPRCQ